MLTTLARVARPIPAMRVETRQGTTFGLTYGASGIRAGSPVGLDRAVLDPLLLAMATRAGADVRQGIAVDAVGLPGGRSAGAVGARARVELSDGRRIEARVVVGADGLRSVVAAAAGVAKPPPLGRRIGLTFHVPEAGAGSAIGIDQPTDARMVIIDHGYIGLAPVPRGRVNVGIVLGATWHPTVRQEGAARVARSLLARVLPSTAGDDVAPILDHVAGAAPLGSATRRKAGVGWLLVGDAAGFLDPFTGEGVHRAIVSAQVAAETIERALASPGLADLSDHDRAMRARFGRKDVVSRLVQTFLGQPAVFEYAARRLAARPHLRETMGLVIGDLLPASRVLHPRYLAALLAP